MSAERLVKIIRCAMRSRIIFSNAREYGLAAHAQFNSKVESARWIDDAQQWEVVVSKPDGSTAAHRADYLFSAVGILNILIRASKVSMALWVK